MCVCVYIYTYTHTHTYIYTQSKQKKQNKKLEIIKSPLSREWLNMRRYIHRKHTDTTAHSLPAAAARVAVWPGAPAPPAGLPAVHFRGWAPLLP